MKENKIMDKRRVALCGFDLLILAVSYSVILLCSMNSSLILNGKFELQIYTSRFFFLAICIIGFRICFKIYNHIWRYAGISIYLRLIISDFIAGLEILLIGQLIPYLDLGLGINLCVISLNCLVSLSARMLYQSQYAHHNAAQHTSAEQSHKMNVAIVGAGNVGATLAQELTRNPQSHYKPLCFIDLDKDKIGQKLNGLPVYAEDEHIVQRIQEMPIHEVVIALPDLDGDNRKRLYDLYSQTGCKVKLYDYPFGERKEQGIRNFIRDIKIEDLLSRDSIQLDNSSSENYYKGKTVLVTGGGGSIGSELCRQIAKMHPKKLIIFDIYENNAYDVQQELLLKYASSLNLQVIIGSIRDIDRLEQVFSTERPQVVIHAAAHKHVPLMEQNPVEAIKNNVFGTYNTVNMAEKYKAEKFVLISTDKAVNPTNIMGASKRLCEMIVQSRYDSKTQFVSVRFGNVLGSNGSVIPLFEKEIAQGGPITITDKRIIRYFMTISEASQLVLQAGAMAKKGEMFVLDMGKPVHIYELAKNMIRLSGLVPEQDIQIVEIGLRPGEKLYEELLIKSEEMVKTENDRILIERDKPLTRAQVEEKLCILNQAMQNASNEIVKEAFQKVVPTFQNPDIVNAAAQLQMDSNAKGNLPVSIGTQKLA
ncbi:polysaccharide biosynthesis protein [Caproicibacterium sp. BJN0003]|uniref:polysaccharide biosynthesis protein n=1 Tax=Caproicibacterium sp. BJN0003 TaxID=2994078 RepID=UPI0022532F40|nr:nucleoside-diphosphate sugar epimerase/dehydratase [Caproicibacterium sp. BJN0003]UZT81957.1 nucleoside-diphosphate sugar epimerase/dehydratase [Caproicibacterium sp. BJN0003]